MQTTIPLARLRKQLLSAQAQSRIKSLVSPTMVPVNPVYSTPKNKITHIPLGHIALDIFAPGVNITSTWIGASGNGETYKTATLSGTWTASPHIAGLAAYFISKDVHEGLDTPAKVLGAMLDEATRGRLVEEGLMGSVNTLGNNGEVGRDCDPVPEGP